jgi:hypothetical protein
VRLGCCFKVRSANFETIEERRVSSPKSAFDPHLRAFGAVKKPFRETKAVYKAVWFSLKKDRIQPYPGIEGG